MNNITKPQASQRKPHSLFDQPQRGNQIQKVISDSESQLQTSTMTSSYEQKLQNKQLKEMKQHEQIRNSEKTQYREQQKMKDQCYEQELRIIDKIHYDARNSIFTHMVLNYDQNQTWAGDTIWITFGLRNVTQQILLLYYKTLKPSDNYNFQLGCELCEQVDPKMGELYIIKKNGQLHFLHALCVHNSKLFEIKEGRIMNIGKAMKIYKTQDCNLCGRPNASLECAAIQGNKCCEAKYHVHCLFNSIYFGKAIAANRTLFCKKHRKQSTQQKEQVNNRDSNHTLQIPIQKKLKLNDNQIQIPFIQTQQIYSSPQAVLDQFAAAVSQMSLKQQNQRKN